MPDDSEEFRHECESKFWLKDTGGKPDKVDDLMKRIEKHRGRASAERLREGMRVEWKKRQEKREGGK